jgi:hypothetical protein
MIKIEKLKPTDDKKCRGGIFARNSRSDNENSTASYNVGRALDVCLIILYAVNLLLVVARLIKRSRAQTAELSDDTSD